MADINLRIPGPTPCREEVLEAVARPMMNYRGPEMAELMEELTGNLKRFLDTSRDVLLVTASGTGGLEATIANMLSPGDRVLGVNAGVFGRRFCVVAEAFGASLQTIEVDEGRALDPETLKRALHEEKDCSAVLLTHNETSTAVAHPIGDLCRVVREESDALVFVDAVSSLGAMPLPIDALDIDVVISGSQKAWGVPSGDGHARAVQESLEGDRACDVASFLLRPPALSGRASAWKLSVHAGASRHLRAFGRSRLHAARNARGYLRPSRAHRRARSRGRSLTRTRAIRRSGARILYCDRDESARGHRRKRARCAPAHRATTLSMRGVRRVSAGRSCASAISDGCKSPRSRPRSALSRELLPI